MYILHIYAYIHIHTRVTHNCSSSLEGVFPQSTHTLLGPFGFLLRIFSRDMGSRRTSREGIRSYRRRCQCR